MEQIVIFTSALIFVASVLLVALTSFLLQPSWKALRTMVSTLPEGEQRVRFNLRSINDPKVKFKAEIILIHFIGCISFGCSMAANVLAIIGVSTIMLGIDIGYYQEANYYQSKIALLVGIFLFICGLWFTALVRIHEALSLAKGRESILLRHIESVVEEPAQPNVGLRAVVTYVHKGPLDGVDWAILALIYTTIFAIALFVLNVLPIASLLVKILIAIGVAILLFFVVWVGRDQFYRFIRWIRKVFIVKKAESGKQ